MRPKRTEANYKLFTTLLPVANHRNPLTENVRLNCLKEHQIIEAEQSLMAIAPQKTPKRRIDGNHIFVLTAALRIRLQCIYDANVVVVVYAVAISSNQQSARAFKQRWILFGFYAASNMRRRKAAIMSIVYVKDATR